MGNTSKKTKRIKIKSWKSKRKQKLFEEERR